MDFNQIVTLIVLSIIAGGHLEKHYGWWSWIEDHTIYPAFQWICSKISRRSA